jgi:glycosyltransferase involved in cell wall biosynthesis
MENDNELNVFVIETVSRGGMIHYAYQMCTALADAGASVTLITADDYELHNFPHNFRVEPMLHLWDPFDARQAHVHRRLIGRLARKGMQFIRRSWRGVCLVREWFRLTTYLIKQRPDVIQFGVVHFPFEAFFLARLRRKGLLITQMCHEFERRERNNWIGRWVNRLYASAYPQFAALFFHAEDNRARFLALFDIPPQKTHVIAHGSEKMFLSNAAKLGTSIHLRDKYGLKPDEPVMLFFGLIAPSKGIPELVEAFAQIKEQTNARLLIAGYPTKFFDLAGFQEQVKQLALGSRLVLDFRYIPIEEVAPLVELASFLVFPYRTSTQSGALQVAYAFGRPVIASCVGGLPEVVEDGRSGFLVPPQNPAALAEKMLLMLNNPTLTAEMGRYAQHLSETRYAWEPIAANILSVYKPLTRESRQPLEAADHGGKAG